MEASQSAKLSYADSNSWGQLIFPMLTLSEKRVMFSHWSLMAPTNEIGIPRTASPTTSINTTVKNMAGVSLVLAQRSGQVRQRNDGGGDAGN